MIKIGLAIKVQKKYRLIVKNATLEKGKYKLKSREQYKKINETLQRTSDLNNFAKISQVFILLPLQNYYQPFKKKKELTKSNYKHLKPVTLHLTF